MLTLICIILLSYCSLNCLKTECTIDPTKQKCYAWDTAANTAIYYFNCNKANFKVDDTSYCDIFNVAVETPVLTLKLSAEGKACSYNGYGCQDGLYCVNAVCKKAKAGLGAACNANSDCLDTLVCSFVKKVCSTPKNIGESCVGVELFYGDCDDHQWLTCGNNNKCIKLFSYENLVFANFTKYMCKSFAVDDKGKCTNPEQLPILQYDYGKFYRKCEVNSDCKYINPNNIKMSFDVCRCPMDSSTAQKYCIYGGGEADMIEDKKMAIKLFNGYREIHTNELIEFIYKLTDVVFRIDFINPAKCSHSYDLNNTYGSLFTNGFAVLDK